MCTLCAPRLRSLSIPARLMLAPSSRIVVYHAGISQPDTAGFVLLYSHPRAYRAQRPAEDSIARSCDEAQNQDFTFSPIYAKIQLLIKEKQLW